MTKRQDALERFLHDALAYIVYEMNRGGEYPQRILETLAHDLGGLARKDKCFLPRVTGYERKMRGAK